MRSYAETPPAGPLRAVVEVAWRAHTGTAPHTQRVLPDGCMDLLLSGGEAVVAGPDTTAHLAGSPAGGVTTGLRFRPGALPALLGVPADALRDRRVPLADVLDPGRRRLLRPAPADGDDSGDTGDAAWLARLALALHAAAGDDRTPASLPQPALRALAGGMPAAELADRLGVTGRTLHRRCVATLGYGPAVARRVLRFRAAAALLYDGVAPAAVAARTGYADQPHLSREVRALAGVSPASLAPRTESPGLAATAGAARSGERVRGQVQANRSSDEPSGSATVA
ncbi:helix-turn-helix domain-containing protein [Pseudonocardia sp. ICBG601]|uniref:helix-turn-helix domain-containing protein n=1 Tax=Pseudonocardia sp. ICBG601 TaxID=2846759 RepID=UPI001CF61A60|nr:helix-turn-helix domain-containing protein [Pseudonocardia sp. ICBG601]